MSIRSRLDSKAFQAGLLQLALPSRCPVHHVVSLVEDRNHQVGIKLASQLAQETKFVFGARPPVGEGNDVEGIPRVFGETTCQATCDRFLDRNCEALDEGIAE